MSELAGHWASRTIEKRTRTVSLFVTLIALAFGGVYQLRQETNLLRYFDSKHRDRLEIERLQSAGVGVLTAELVVDARETGDPLFTEPEALLRLTRTGEKVGRLEGVINVMTAGDLLLDRALLEEGRIDSGVNWRQTLDDLKSLPKMGQMLRVFRTDDGLQSRLSIQVEALDFQELEPILEQAVQLVSGEFPDQRVWVTGEFPLILKTQKNLLQTMAYSLGLTFLVVSFILMLLLRSARLFLSAVLVNIWPILVLFGAMGWLGYPLDSTTIMVGAVALALAVDDTLHTLGYVRLYPAGLRRRERVSWTLSRTGPAQILSSVILAGGFPICSTTEVLPVGEFCFLASVAITAALAADLFLMPALIGMREGTGTGKK